MKTVEAWGKLLFIMVVVMGFSIGTALAQTVIDDIRDNWVGTKWQVTLTQQGYEWSGDFDVPPDAKVRGSVKFFGMVDDVSEAGAITVTLYLPTCDVYGPVVMNYLAGDYLNFTTVTDPAASVFGLTALTYWTGKMNKKGVLRGKFMSLGGYGTGVAPMTMTFQAAGLKGRGTTKDHACGP